MQLSTKETLEQANVSRAESYAGLAMIFVTFVLSGKVCFSIASLALAP